MPDRGDRAGGPIRRGGDGDDADFFPGHGGIAGLVKTLAREWPTVRAAWSTSRPERPGRHARRPAGRRGVRRRRLGRGRLRPGPSDPPADGREPARAHATPAIELKPGDPVLISGGARGITALVAAELARAWRPTLLIVGTTPVPAEPESADTAGPRRARPRSRPRCTPGSAARAGRPGPAEIEAGLPGPAPRPRGPREPGDPPPDRGARRLCPGRRPRPGGPGRRPRRLARAATATPSA